MSDFASAAMLRLISLGLARLGGSKGTSKISSEALVPLGEKRRILEQLWQQLGPDHIVRIGEGVHEISDEPALMALTMATDFHDLLQRLGRLERFVHSRHRVLVEPLTDKRLRVRHVSVVKGNPPTPAEDLLVWGLIVALADRIGVEGLQTRLDADKQWRRSKEGKWRRLSWPTETSTWMFSWRADPSPCSPVASLSSQPTADEATRLRQLILNDPSRQWTVERAAGEMGLSRRTLQRRLNTVQTGFARQLASARIAAACRMLIQTDSSPNEIGYACGFSDQSHFIRTFKQQTAMTPVVYRSQFLVSKEGSG